MLKIALETALEILNAKNAAFLLFDEKSDTLRFYMATGERSNALKNIEIALGQGIAGTVAKTRKALFTNDVNRDNRWLEEISQNAHIEVRAIACHPVILGDKLIGVIQMLDKQDNSNYDQKDLALLGRLSHMMALFSQMSQNKERLGEEFDRLEEKLRKRHSIVGESKAIKRSIHQAEKVASSKASILLTGESGTGKELFAHLIHDKSSRQANPFVSISCGALPASILERELFGHEKGAFTGADTQKIGLFEAAHRGVLFLDEIGEMPLDMQVKLLRVLQEESFIRLGGVKPIQVDVRIISATHQNLEQMVKEGTFRQDLFYRINVINLQLPSLRERKEDIADLLHFFIKKHTAPGEKPKKPQQGLISHLKNQSWPGNIRQLENAVERAIVLEESDFLSIDGFPGETDSSPSSIHVDVGNTLKEANDAFRRSFITSTLNATGGNRTKAAKVLDLQRSYLSRLIKELNIHDVKKTLF